jgi:hypothetical protein
MRKIFVSAATLALLFMFLLPSASNAAERRPNGVRPSDAAAATELSSNGRYYGHQRYYGHHYYGRYRYWGPQPDYYPYAGYSGYPYWGYPYWGCSLCGGYYRPWFWAYPTASIGGSGPRWWW